MKRGGWVAAGCVGLAMLAVVVFVPPNAARRSAAATRRELREQGFKTDLADFDFTTSAELRAREGALTNAVELFGRHTDGWRARRDSEGEVLGERSWRVGDAAALPVWKQDRWRSIRPADPLIRSRTLYRDDDPWPSLRVGLDWERESLDRACSAAISGPIRFHLDASKGHAMLLPHLPCLKALAITLSARAMLDLHDGNAEGAWTNVLAVTRLVTAFTPEPSEVSHLTRMACATIVAQATWQWIQARGASDQQLVRLQREWESVNYFDDLPETAAFARASAVATCQAERRQPRGALGITVTEALQSPRQAVEVIKARWDLLRYRYHGSYEDEAALLRYYQDREGDLKQAGKAPDWKRLRQIRGATNLIHFQSQHVSATLSLLNTRQVMLASSMYVMGRDGGPPTLLSRAAEAEARRRVIVAALAVERYRVRHGAYPNDLAAVVPELLPSVPLDFADGQPLRYRPTDDGSFVLYSVGLDGVDDGGVMPAQRRPDVYPPGEIPPTAVRKGGDLVWPRLASETDVRAHLEAERLAAEAQAQARAEAEAEAQREAWVRRIEVLTVLGRVYAKQKAGLATEPAREMPNIVPLLRNDRPRAAIPPSFSDMLTLKPVAESQPGVITFDVAIRHAALGSSSTVLLLVDALPDETEGEGGEAQDCDRAPDGGCRLRWDTAGEPSGRHFVRAHLSWDDGTNTVQIDGPLRLVELAEPTDPPRAPVAVGDP